MFAELTTLAQSKAKNDRRGLLYRLTDMFLDGAQDHSERESVLYADIVLTMIGTMDLPDRAQFADQVADSDRMPRPVVCTLANDEIEVASPVLTRSPVLTDEDLIAVIQSRPQSHLLAVSKRESLSEAVTDGLVERGDTSVVRSVSANRGATFSAHGIDKLAGYGAKDATVRQNAVNRPDIRSRVVARIEPLVSPELAAELRDLLARADDTQVKDMAETAEATLSERLKHANYGDELKSVLERIHSGKMSVDTALESLSGSEKFTDTISLISALSRTPEHIVSNALFKMPNQPVAILLRSIGASDAGYSAVQAVRATRLRLPASHVEQGLEEFRKLDLDDAKRSLRFLRARVPAA